MDTDDGHHRDPSRENEDIVIRSPDGGRTWSSEINLRDDGLNWDMGYPRMVQRPDGKLVTAYYYATASRPQQFIGVTICQLEPIGERTDLNDDGVVNLLDYASLASDI
jgi:hypothetical protein